MAKTKAKAAKLTEPQAALLRRVTAPGVEEPRYVWQGTSGAWYISVFGNGSERVHGPTVKALISGGYLENRAALTGDEAGQLGDIPPGYFLSAKGAAWLEAERRAERLAATAGERMRAREMADALLLANQLDQRAEINGVYPHDSLVGLYEVDYYDTLGSGRFVVRVDVIAGTADLQRQ